MILSFVSTLIDFLCLLAEDPWEAVLIFFPTSWGDIRVLEAKNYNTPCPDWVMHTKDQARQREVMRWSLHCQLPQPNLLYTNACSYTHDCAASALHACRNFERFLLSQYRSGRKVIITLSCHKTSTSLREEYLYINDIDLGLNKFISIYEGDMKIGNVLLSECVKWSLHEDLLKISDWSVKWEVPFNINKCKILQVGSRNIKND